MGVLVVQRDADETDQEGVREEDDELEVMRELS